MRFDLFEIKCTLKNENVLFSDFPNKDCTYMMARDFVDRNFTILKNKKTFTVLTKEVAVIFTGDGKVMLNNSNESQ